MWTEDLRWAWKLRDQKRKLEKEAQKSQSTQQSNEQLELYAADLEHENDTEPSILNKSVKDVT